MIRSFAETALPENQVDGVSFKQLRTYPDDRGFFRELIRDTDSFFSGGFAQWSHSKMARNAVKAWHFHHLQIDWWYIGIGAALIALYDNRPESATYQRKLEFKLGDSDADPDALSAIVRIPPGVLHGCKALSEFTHLFYITSRTYDSNDEGRIPFNSPTIPYSWGNEAEVIVSPNDRRHFEPTNPRKTAR